MTLQEAGELVALSREARWDFPSSQGRPVKWDVNEAWVKRLIRRQADFPETARFLIDNGRADAAVELAANVWRLWVLSRDLEGGRKFLASVLKETGKPSTARALALYGDSLLAFRQGKINESHNRSEEALTIARQANDPEAQALSHLGLSRVFFEKGDYEAALSQAIEARKLATDLDPALGQAPLFLHAQSIRMLGRYEEAELLFRQSVALNRRINDRGMIMAELTNLGFVEAHLGNRDMAEKCFSDAERLAPKLDDPYSIVMDTLTKAAVAFLKGEHPKARSFLSESDKLLQDSGMQLGPDDKLEFDWLKERLAEDDHKKAPPHR